MGSRTGKAEPSPTLQTLSFVVTMVALWQSQQSPSAGRGAPAWTRLSEQAGLGASEGCGLLASELSGTGQAKAWTFLGGGWHPRQLCLPLVCAPATRASDRLCICLLTVFVLGAVSTPRRHLGRCLPLCVWVEECSAHSRCSSKRVDAGMMNERTSEFQHIERRGFGVKAGPAAGRRGVSLCPCVV